jgi:hypothetical protein
LEKRKGALQHCIKRLETLNEQTQERLATERKEDENSATLRKWVVRVRSLVMVPRTEEQMQKAKPGPQGELSTEMVCVLEDAKKLGIDHFEDVQIVENSFKSMAWCMFTLSIICRKPTLAETEMILSMASTIPLPGEKTVRTLKAMVQKAAPWRLRAVKALCPLPGGSKVPVESLKEVLDAAKEVPVHMPEAWRLQLAIKDNGSRHCTCGGLNDGRLMICCDNCQAWFHGSCVDVTKDVFAEEQRWLCPPCSGKPSTTKAVVDEQALELVYSSDEVPENEIRGRDDFSEHAPDPEKLWPPVGLIDTTQALEAIGSDCFMIPDDIEPLRPSTVNSGPNNALPGLIPTGDVVGSLLGLQSSESVPALMSSLPSSVIPATSLVTPGTLLSTILAGAAITAPASSGVGVVSGMLENGTGNPRPGPDDNEITNQESSSDATSMKEGKPVVTERLVETKVTNDVPNTKHMGATKESSEAEITSLDFEKAREENNPAESATNCEFADEAKEGSGEILKSISDEALSTTDQPESAMREDENSTRDVEMCVEA